MMKIFTSIVLAMLWLRVLDRDGISAALLMFLGVSLALGLIDVAAAVARKARGVAPRKGGSA